MPMPSSKALTVKSIVGFLYLNLRTVFLISFASFFICTFDTLIFIWSSTFILSSGKSYLMGEAGNETVIPDNQLGGASGGITINIQNMSGSQQDLSNLKQTILDVMQQSSTRRGRV